MTAAKIAPTMIPQTLNGYPVKAFTIHPQGDRALVLVCRPQAFQPWVAATWWPELGETWQWGHYFDSWEEADAHRGRWIAEALTTAQEAR